MIRPTILISSALMTHCVVADYVGCGFEFEDIGDGRWTMQVFAEFSSMNDQLNAVFGDSQSPLHISATNGFYQHALGGYSSSNVNPAWIPFFPSLAHDSWVTIGSNVGEENAMLDIGIDWTNFENGGAIDTDNGTWFATPDDPQVYAGDDMRVLIGQFTTFGWDSEISGLINLQGKNSNNETFVVRDVYFGWIPAPTSLALLGVAGLFTRRR